MRTTLRTPPSRGELGTLLICSVRYALGRQSYVVGQVSDLVRRFYLACSEVDRGVIRANVEEHLGSQHFSDPADIRRTWETLAAWMRGSES